MNTKYELNAVGLVLHSVIFAVEFMEKQTRNTGHAFIIVMYSPKTIYKEIKFVGNPRLAGLT